MITQRAINYAKVLDSLQVAWKDVEQVKNLLSQVEQVEFALDNPLVK